MAATPVTSSLTMWYLIPLGPPLISLKLHGKIMQEGVFSFGSQGMLVTFTLLKGGNPETYHIFSISLLQYCGSPLTPGLYLTHFHGSRSQC